MYSLFSYNVRDFIKLNAGTILSLGGRQMIEKAHKGWY